MGPQAWLLGRPTRALVAQHRLPLRVCASRSPSPFRQADPDALRDTRRGTPYLLPPSPLPAPPPINAASIGTTGWLGVDENRGRAHERRARSLVGSVIKKAMLAQDPLRLDRSLSDFARRYRQFVAALAISDAPEHAFELAPPEVDEELLYDLLRRPDPDPFTVGAARWLGFLLVEQAVIAERRAWSQALHRARHPIHLPEAGSFTLAEMRERALTESERRNDWMAAFQKCAGELSSKRFALWEARLVSAERLGIETEYEGERLQRVRELAGAFITETNDAYAEFGVRSWKALLDIAIGADVPGEWPSRINTRTMAELLHEGGWFDGLSPEGFEARRFLGASSAMRGLILLGRVWHDAAASPRLPFALAREPGALRGRTAGALFGLLPLGASFAERRLRIGRAQTRDTLRKVARVALIGARQSAMRALLQAESGKSQSAYQDRFIELGPQCLHFEVPPELAGAVLMSDHALADFTGLLLAASRARQLMEKHDEDWFRNPRAARELRADFESPPSLTADPSELSVGSAELQSLLVTRL